MLKLGRKYFTKDERDLKLSHYKATNLLTLPNPPTTFGHYSSISNWGMLANDNVGDCVFAGADHETILWTAEGTGTPAMFTDSNTLSDYSAVTGYNPNDPNSDNGTEVRTVLQYRQKTGMIDSLGRRHKIGAYLALDNTNVNELKEAVYLFGAVGIGINFPDSAMSQFDAGKPWSVVKNSSIGGGHYVPIVGYDSNYIYCVTWGKIQPMTYSFFTTYCEEAWAILSTEFLNGKGVSPEGFNLSQLQADLTAITGTPIPTPTPTPNPNQATINSLNADITSLQTIITNLQQIIKNLGG